MTAILLAPSFEAESFQQQDTEELLHDMRVQTAMRTARAICDGVEDLQSRSDAVVFEAPSQSDQLKKDVSAAARRLDELEKSQSEQRKTG